MTPTLVVTLHYYADTPTPDRLVEDLASLPEEAIKVCVPMSDEFAHVAPFSTVMPLVEHAIQAFAIDEGHHHDVTTAGLFRE